MRASFILFLLLVACSGAPPAGKERPFYTEAPTYFDYTKFEPGKFPPPPASGSREDEEDLAALDRYQRIRTQAQCDSAAHEVKPDFEHFFGHMNPFVKPTPDEVDEIFWKLRSDVGRTVSKVKKLYNRERPFRRDPKRFHACVKEEHGMAYPSGHAAISRLYAQVLSELDPAHSADYFAQATTSGLNRVISGVHHMTDIAQGARLADEVYEAMKKSEAYQADLARLRSHLRR